MRLIITLFTFLITFHLFSTLAYAASGDITLGNNTYTQVAAEKKVMAPILKRISTLKTANIKARYIQAQIRIYTNKQKIAQRKYDTTLAGFYAIIILNLRETPTTASGAMFPVKSSMTTQSQIGWTGWTAKTNTQSNVTITNGWQLGNWTYNNANIWVTGTNLTTEQKAQLATKQTINSVYNDAWWANQSKSKFLSFLSDYNWFYPWTFWYEYASSLTFNQP